MGETYTVREVGSVGELHALRNEWRRIEDAQPLPLPFFSWEWSIAWWAHFPERGFRVRDRMFVHTVRDRAGALVAVAPLMITDRPGRGPVRTRFLQFFGADPNVTETRGVACMPEHDDGAHRALIDHLGRSRAWDWMLWGGLHADRGGARAVGEHATEWTGDVPCFYLELPPTWDELRSGLSRNIKESLRKCYNSLKRDGHEFTVDVARARDAIGPAVGHFLRLHRMRADVGGTVTHRNVFDSAPAEAFLRDVCSRFAQRDATRIVLLKIGGEVVAGRIGFVLGKTLYLYYSGYDPAWGKYSVMTTTVAEAIKYAIGEKLSIVNLSTGSDVSKTRWSPKEISFRSAVQVAPSLRGRLAYRVHRQAQELRNDPRARAFIERFLGRARNA